MPHCSIRGANSFSPSISRAIRLRHADKRLYNVRMTRKALGLAAALVLGVTFTVAVAQVRRPMPATNVPQTPAQLALHALNEGRYDEVVSLTEKDQFDPTLVSLHARALIERGKYKEAEDILRPVAQRQPESDAALELGLLLRMLSRSDATPILTKVGDS